MSKPPVKVSVTPFCLHADGWSDHGEAYEGTHLVVNHQGVWVDGEQVIYRDRRARVNREKGHPWLADGAPYSGFSVSVETRKETE